ncbi:DtxR family transcriptional regulator [Tersicoccus solisilvae]|uniref:DtxR family transcriptional regulator n=1 Tax=Tersicoccus solisilvae TaxID=1882339 RepID=A0ABQ1P2K1_9MICC|nr:metal-dependent transcriptional regulator [Tersicoccus solisilvae]GGC89553.1 DtxR family transcriptional regulator [Tersicoccus solisilvae]
MTDLIDTTEMYLRTILELEEEGIVPMRARIAERLNHSGPTVSQTVARMERDGLVHVTEERRLDLSDSGRRRATGVMRKHRLAERLLHDVIGLDWAYVHEEACRWEHVMSERVERRLLGLLHQPTESPYGNPIPGLVEIGGPDAGSFTDGVTALTTRVARAGREVAGGEAGGESGPGEVTVQIARLAEPVQFDPDLLAQLDEYGIRPGARVRVSAAGGYVRCATDDHGVLELADDVAAHIFVADH